MSDWERRERARRAEVMALPTLKVRHHAVVAGERGEARASVSVGPEGEVLALWTAAEDLPAQRSSPTRSAGAAFPDSRAPRPVAARVTTHTSVRAVTMVRLAELPLAHVKVQPLPQGRVLAVAARARWRPEGADRNAIVYDPEGNVLAEETLGDGIGHVFATRTGHIWVGYFDEGVFGNYGWGGPGPAPLGACGLARFSPDLRPDWRFPGGDPWGWIADCYALNVAGEAAWTCYYTGFPVVRSHDGVLTGWRNDISGIQALAVGDSARIALYGGYGANRDRLAAGDLGDGRLHTTAEYRIVLPDGQPLPARTQVIGRGPDLHFIADHDWYRLALEDVPVRPDK
ncbi:hypothetical protein DPM19_30835 [Actinomadura craniellae]|uniref:Uncharacterized protein n=1 Tax=Actinomadura craniellae TaxID=2231787 RepID=A0A365GX70_9ACTN|nr:hypothetical protein [Actinomadura craniellae]RAY11420.1 hypothetical protein DPM19_30835 [Actinomadura craniellae]